MRALAVLLPLNAIAVLPPTANASPFNVTSRVFIKYEIGGQPERLILGLFGTDVPRTTANFIGLCKGTLTRNGKRLQFAGTRMHRIIPGFMAQGGGAADSFVGGTFADENFRVKHSRPGRLSMANYGRDTNRAQFFITFKPTPHLNGKHVVFGQVEVASFSVLRKLEAVGTRPGKTTQPVVIKECGLLDGG